MIYFMIWLLGTFFFIGITDDPEISFFWPLTIPCLLTLKFGQFIRGVFLDA